MSKLIILLLLFSIVNVSVSQTLLANGNYLQCYYCNSLSYTQCGERENFNTTLQLISYCSGYCVKVVVYPGNFIIRTCSTLLSNITTLDATSQQCYLDTFVDLSSSINNNIPAYYCFCNDRVGCNNANNKSFNEICVNIFLIFSFINFLI